MTWVQIVAGLIASLAAFVSWLKDKQAIDAGIAEATANHLKGALDEIRKANAVRDAVRADIAANPERVREPDKYSRD